jgi:Uncharacterized protein family UPF0016
VTDSLVHIGPAMTTAFLASLVEAVEALTIVLAVAIVRGWRPAGLGALGGLLVLALIVIALGPLLDRLPLSLLQLAIGILLLLFGMRWLRKAILRMAGVIRCTTKRRHSPPRRQNCTSKPAAMRLGSIGWLHSPASRRCFSRDLKWCSS